MSKLDEIVDRAKSLQLDNDMVFKQWNTTADQDKREIKKLILDLFKEAEYDPYKFVEKVEAL